MESPHSSPDNPGANSWTQTLRGDKGGREGGQKTGVSFWSNVRGKTGRQHYIV